MAHRFDLVCCLTQEEFRREKKAITQAGQIKSPGERHEKDDRHRLDDRSRYVLGWSNAAKIAALEEKAKPQQKKLTELAGRISTLQQEQKALKGRLTILSKLDEYPDFRDLDWQPIAFAIARLETEKRDLEAASDLLKTLTDQLAALEIELQETERQLDDKKDKRSKIEQKISVISEAQQQTRTLLNEAGPKAAEHFATLQLMRHEAFGDQSLTVESCDNREREMRDWLQTKIDSEDKKLSRLGEKIIRAMTEYKEEWKLETREVANFQSQLARERESIKERITLLNESLTQIDYNPGRFITLEVQTSPDAASLAYQFGLEWGAVRSRSFRFVVIDEAFGRGSDESAQYGLQLFAQLNLQLLIVTPLQKIHIIEPFVSSVSFVHNKEGRNSELRNLTIEEYRTEKEKAVE